MTEKQKNAIRQALVEDIPIKQLCADCTHHRLCFISKLITETHIENDWLTLRCVRCKYFKRRKA